MATEYGYCKTCGLVVYRDDNGPWLYAAGSEWEYVAACLKGYFPDAPAYEDLPNVQCGCND